jgi:hypothetical protein
MRTLSAGLVMILVSGCGNGLVGIRGCEGFKTIFIDASEVDSLTLNTLKQIDNHNTYWSENCGD